MSTTGNLRSIVGTFQEQNVTFLAASVAFYAFFSIVPLLLLVLAVGSLIGGEAFADRIVSLVEGQLSSQGATVVEEAMTSESGRAGASAVGFVALLWSALKVFRGIDLAFDEVYGLEPDTSLLGQLRDGIIVVAATGVAVVLMVGLGSLLARPMAVEIPYVRFIGYAVLIVGLTAVFLPLYYVMPPVDVTAREILPGALVAAIGWLVLQALFQVYAGNAGRYEAYGLLGAVLLFLTWLYFASILILLGAVVNAVLSDRVAAAPEAGPGTTGPAADR